jgi:hypothetical protein
MSPRTNALSASFLALALTFGVATPATAQSPDMSFFLALRGPTRGADRPTLAVSDAHCHDLAYARGYGHLTWRAYLDGKAAEGEGGQLARDRIGGGPWHNFHGVVIAESLAELHSDENNLWQESALTVTGETAPAGAVEFPWGSELDGGDFTREGPFLCFGVPG